ncbi:MAG: helix-turn-helix transcriptional regulator [Eubacterium sp.]|nr:helix-turn-helix transcriptional regulator [Eubacterium sp.]
MIDTFPTRITRLRKNAGMSQADLARRLHIKRSSIQAWENGSSYPSTDNLIALSKLFHVSTDYLLDYNSQQTVCLDNYSADEQLIILRMLQYFDTTASSSRTNAE